MSDDMVRRLETAHTQMQREMDRLRKQLDEAQETIRARVGEILWLKECLSQEPPASPSPDEKGRTKPCEGCTGYWRDEAGQFQCDDDCTDAPASPSPVLRDAVIEDEPMWARRFGPRFTRKCRNPEIIECAGARCQYANACQFGDRT